MKTSLRKILKQRRMMDQKLESIGSRNDSGPPSGWIKAVRVSLGLSIRQLANLVGVSHSSINQIEKREPSKRVTLASLEMLAEAMDCKLVYAIIPKASNITFEKIVQNRANIAAENIIKKVDHTMKLESQATTAKALKLEVERIAKELIENNDPYIWDAPIKSKSK